MENASQIQSQGLEHSPSFPLAHDNQSERAVVRWVLTIIWITLTSATIYTLINFDQLFKRKDIVIAKLMEKKGEVEFRPEQLPVWGPVTKRHDFFEQDTVSTAGLSSAKIQLNNNMSLTVGPFSQVQIFTRTGKQNKENYFVNLLRGELQLTKGKAIPAGMPMGSVTVISGDSNYLTTGETEILKLVKNAGTTGASVIEVKGNVEITTAGKTARSVKNFRDENLIQEQKVKATEQKNMLALSKAQVVDLKKSAIAYDFSKANSEFLTKKNVAVDTESNLRRWKALNEIQAPPKPVATVAALPPPPPPVKALDNLLLPNIGRNGRLDYWTLSSLRKILELPELPIQMSIASPNINSRPLVKVTSAKQKAKSIDINGRPGEKVQAFSLKMTDLGTLTPTAANGRASLQWLLLPGYINAKTNDLKPEFDNRAVELNLHSLSDWGNEGIEIYLDRSALQNTSASIGKSNWIEQKNILSKNTANVIISLKDRSKLLKLLPILKSGNFGVSRLTQNFLGNGNFVLNKAEPVAKYSGTLSEPEEIKITKLLGGELAIRGKSSDVIRLSPTPEEREKELLELLQGKSSINVIINGSVVRIEKIILTKKQALFKSLAKQADGVIENGVAYIQP